MLKHSDFLISKDDKQRVILFKATKLLSVVFPSNADKEGSQSSVVLLLLA